MDSTEVIKQEPKAVVPVASAQGLLEMAITSGADIDKLEKLMALQERYDAKNAKSSFTRSLGLFQANCPSIKKLKKGHNSNYAPLEDIISQVKDVMFSSGLCYSFSQKQADNQIEVSCHLSHVDGHTETVSMRSDADKSGNKQAIQAIASTVTYLRRYTFTGVTGIVPCDEDSDGRIEKALVIEHCDSSQVIKINELIEKTGVDLNNFGSLVNQTFGINCSSFAQYTKEQADFAIKKLESKL